MEVLKQAGRVGGLGIALAAVVGLLVGVPTREPEPTAAVCLPPGADAPTGELVVRWVTQSDAHRELDMGNAVFLDARSHLAYHEGHVAGAVSAPMGSGALPEDALVVARGARTVVCYCDTSDDCGRSTRLASLLAAAGVPDVRVLEGGMPAWMNNGFPAEAGACVQCPND